MKYDTFNGYRRITRREARARYDKNLPLHIGGSDSKGAGAVWSFESFKTANYTTFDAVADYFQHRYCTGPNRIVSMCFYAIK